VPLQGWAVAKSRRFLAEYRIAKQPHQMLYAHPSEELPSYGRAADLLTFAVRSWITFSAIMHNLALQRLRR
jgi:hypothetical protein